MHPFLTKAPVERFLYEASLGCLMAVLPLADAAPIVAWAHEEIKPEDLIGDGYESSPHVTILYGFEPSVSAARVQKVISEKWNRRLAFSLGKITRFDTSPEHDVLKCDVKGTSELRELNQLMLAEFGDEVSQTYPDYRPHMTLAYVRKKACQSLNGHAKFDDNVYVLNSLVFSLAGSTSKFPIYLHDAASDAG